jgi:hypothetical protein
LGGAVDLYVAVVDLSADLLRDRRRDQLRWEVLEVHAASGAIAFKSVADVEVLLEVVT